MTLLITLAKKLISIPSTADNTSALEEVLNLVKKELKDFTFEEFDKEGVKSLLVYKEKSRPEKFKVILNAHLDVVAGRDEQFTPKEIDGKLFGRGAYDMKAAAAVMVEVFKDTASQVDSPIGLQLVTDEEIGGHKGTKHQIQEGVRADFVIAGENTNHTVINQAKGIMWVKITAKGKTAHGAYPWQGENAVAKMQEVLAKIQKDYPVPTEESWKTTINIASVETANKTFNKVPDECTALLDIRYTPEDKEEASKYIESFKNNSTDVEILFKEAVHYTDKSNLFIEKLQKAVEKITTGKAELGAHHGASDIRHYTQQRVDGVEFGPIGAGQHSDSEWVDVKSLEDYHTILKEFLLSL